MDPNATWTEFMTAMGTDDIEGMKEAGAALRNWIDKGGFWPTNEGRSTVYHHLRLQADICGLGVWEPKS